MNLSYLVKPKDRIEVKIFIDTSNGINILQNYCPFSIGSPPCRGNIAKGCHNTWETCSSPNKTMCLDEVGRLGLRKGELPEHIVTETSKWGRESYIVSQTLSEKSMRVDMQTRDTTIDMSKRERFFVKYLLKEWSLGEELKLTFCNEGGREVLDADTMRKVEQVVPEIMTAFVRGAHRKMLRGMVNVEGSKGATTHS